MINVVTGFGQEVGSPLVEHRDIAKVTFTGSDTTGAKVYEAAARGMKRVSMELGGKSPNIVFDDADLDQACVGAVAGVFGATGQMCTAGSRLLVQNSIREEFTERLLAMGRSLKLGDPMSAETQMGPIATPPQFEKVLRYIDVAKSEGARCVWAAHRPTAPGLRVGSSFSPRSSQTLRTHAHRAGGGVRAGAVHHWIRRRGRGGAIGNDMIYGLAAGVWTRDIGRAVRMSKALRAGWCGSIPIVRTAPRADRWDEAFRPRARERHRGDQ